MSTVRSTAGADALEGGSGLVTGLKVTSALLAVSLVVQAWLGSTGFFRGEPDLVTAHEMLGNIFFLVAAAQLVLAFLASQRGLAPRALVIVSLLLLLDVVAQLGLGYAGRDNGDVLAWHLPNGVLLMGLCTIGVAQAWGSSFRR